LHLAWAPDEEALDYAKTRMRRQSAFFLVVFAFFSGAAGLFLLQTPGQPYQPYEAASLRARLEQEPLSPDSKECIAGIVETSMFIASVSHFAMRTALWLVLVVTGLSLLAEARVLVVSMRLARIPLAAPPAPATPG